MTFRLKANHPDYNAINYLQTLLQLVINGGNDYSTMGREVKEIPALERASIIEILKAELEELLNFGGTLEGLGIPMEGIENDTTD